jgi:MoaA/NifB/PqqE/SkfB family radical SAM enzyme
MQMARTEDPIYDAGIFWSVTNRCNLNCNYCLNRAKDNVEYRINIPSLLKTLDNTDKIFRITFSGGEPFLVPNIVEACVEITKDHFVGFSTNLTSKKITELVEKVNPEKVLCIAASVQIKELERLNLVDRYVHNFHLCRDNGFCIDPCVVAYPNLIEEIEKYTSFFKEKGIDLQFDPFLGMYQNKEYPDSYTSEEIRIFNLRNPTKFKQKGKLCNAGYNIAIVDVDGAVHPCFNLTNISMGNIYEKISFKKQLIRCPFEICSCPLNHYEQYLFEKAMKRRIPRFLSRF